MVLTVLPMVPRHAATQRAAGGNRSGGWIHGTPDTKSMEPYQHHDLEALREAINRRNEADSGFGHIFGHTGGKEADTVPDSRHDPQCL